MRLDPGQAGHIETHLPKELKDEWDLSGAEEVTYAVAGPKSLGRDEFLEVVREKAELGSEGEAVHATRAVFCALRQALPERDVRDTAGSLPAPLRGLWDTACEQGPGFRPEPAGHTYSEDWLGIPEEPAPREAPGSEPGSPPGT